MSEILSQSEIEALLSSLSSDGAESEPAQTSSVSTRIKPQSSNPAPTAQPSLHQTQARASGGYVETYDFRRPDKLSKDQLRTLQMLHETFARLGGSNLSAFLRAPVNIDLVSLEQVPYEEYLRSINQSVFTIFSLPPLNGQAVLELEFGSVFTMIDRMLGGPGRAISRNVLTDIERPLIRQIIERMFQALKSAWEGVVIVNPGIEGMETSAQFVQIAPPNDIVVTILFEVKIGNHRSAMSLCIPYLVLKPITTKLSAQKWFSSSSRKMSPTVRRTISGHIQLTEIDCSIRLGQAEITVGDFLRLQAGDIVRLEQKTDEDLVFTVGDVPKFEGKPALQGKKLVFSISDSLQE